MTHRAARAEWGRLAVCVLCLLAVACGKKGPPLAPLVRLPAAVDDVEVTRLGREIYLSFDVPDANLDRSTPVDLAFIDVYAYTGAVAPRVGFVDQATRIARIPVAPVVSPDGASPPPAAPAAAVGSTVTIVDTLPADADASARRFYLAVPINTRDRPGLQHAPVEVRLTPVPAPPLSGSVDYTATTISLTWTADATTVPTLPAQAARVNVYRAPVGGSPALAWQQARPRPLNGSPIAAPPFTEPVAFGVETCYVLRRIVGEGAAAIESDASAPACVTPVDVFAPAAPTQLVAVATGSGISLLWEAPPDVDTAGYLVLRGAVGDTTLRPLTPEPVTDVRYVDTTAVAGMRYVYAVVAVDGRAPTPNVSAESARVEETAQ